MKNLLENTELGNLDDEKQIFLISIRIKRFSRKNGKIFKIFSNSQENINGGEKRSREIESI